MAGLITERTMSSGVAPAASRVVRALADQLVDLGDPGRRGHLLGGAQGHGPARWAVRPAAALVTWA